MKSAGWSKGYYFLAGLSIILVVLLAGLLVDTLILKKSARTLDAEMTGRRMVIEISTGKIVSADSGIKVKEAATPAANDTDKSDKVEKAGSNSEKTAPAVSGTVARAESSNKPKIVIIIGELALSSTSTERAFSLPPEVTFGFSPYAPDAAKWAQRATDEKHDVLINMPMQTVNYPMDDPGKFALVSGLTDTENLARLDLVLGKLAVFSGIYTSPHENFTQSLDKLRPVLDSIKAHHLLFVYGGTTSSTILQQVATANSLPVIITDVQLDNDDNISAQSIDDKFTELERIARRKGVAVAIGNPYPMTIKATAAWLNKADAKGFQVIPISGLASNLKR